MSSQRISIGGFSLPLPLISSSQAHTIPGGSPVDRKHVAPQSSGADHAARIAELEAENANLLQYNQHLSQMLNELEAGLIGGYGTDQPINPVHQLTVDRAVGQVRLTFTTRSGDSYRIAIAPMEARAYAANLIRIASDVSDVEDASGNRA